MDPNTDRDSANTDYLTRRDYQLILISLLEQGWLLCQVSRVTRLSVKKLEKLLMQEIPEDRNS